MPANNSITNRNRRRAAAFKRFSFSAEKQTADEKYQERKELEKAALMRYVASMP